MPSKLLIIFLLCIYSFGFTQITYLQDIYKGGITADSYNQWINDQPGQLDVYIEPGSTIKKAILFASVIGEPEDRTAFLNGEPILLSSSNTLNESYLVSSSDILLIYRDIAVDVTHLISSTNDTYIITPPIQSSLFTVYGAYVQFYLVVLYENIGFPNVAVNIMINNIDPQPVQSYPFLNLNPIDLSKSVALTVNSSHFCNTTTDGSFVYVDGVDIGIIGGDDGNSPFSCSGVTGSFYFQDEQLFGLGNDIANTTMNGVDGIASIESYILNNTFFDVDFEYQSNQPSSDPASNPVHELVLAYSTSCDSFSVSTPNDTTLCQGETLHLNTTGGQAYEWLPATGLSCSDCPNPIFTADSSMFYTVRIWNNDTCSVVRPLKLNVRPQPEFGNLTTTPSECGANTGTATLNALPNNGTVTNWQEVGGATQTSNVFQNLSTGNHTFFFVDTNGCQSADTTVFVGEINTTSASFSVSPQTGAVPLTVQFTNTSLNATNFEWFVEGVSMGSSLPSFDFSTSGTFEIMLVAWQNDPACADTAIQTVVVYDSLMISVPNVFTPNGDGVNDFFEITNSLPVHCELVIVNRWGNVMYEYSDNLGAGSTKLWDGYSLLFHGDIVEGTYFYDVTFSGANEQTQELEKLGILPIKKSGFVEVRR